MAVSAGSIAGSVNKDGYIQIGYKRKPYLAQNIIWEMHNGPIPYGMVIDHIDHNRLNNLLNNFRLVTKAVNNQNKSRASNNTSGMTGVYWHKRDKVWVASIRVNGVLIQLGQSPSLSKAIKLREEANIKYGFHKNHGKPTGGSFVR